MKTRRDFLTILGGAYLSIPHLLQAQYGNNDAKAKNIIYIFLNGGIAAQETFDPKYLAPSEYKGPFDAIPTKTSGLMFSATLPKLAEQTDKFTVIHSMTHGQAAHENGTNHMFTGYKPSPALQYASLGSIIAHELGGQNNLPPYVTIPSTPNPYANSGFISTKFNPFSLGSDPASPNFKVQDLNFSVEESRFDRRKSILEAVDSKFKSEADADNVKAIDSFYQQAFDLINSDKAKEAFDISKEKETTRELYGKTTAGSRLLMARRLVEAGVRVVKVNYGSFDAHDRIKTSMEAQMPQLDQALAALFLDLSLRGLLSETLVVVTTEFGRTSKINKTEGRDHNNKVFSTLIGGAGINNGIVYGKSNDVSTEVEENPVTPDDLFATIYNRIGISPNKELLTQDLRPVKISLGKPVKELMS